MRVSVHFSHTGVQVSGPCAVIVDVLRATTTLTHAVAHGAASVVPVATPAEALALRGQDANALACGERDGRKVPGFDLGNSPLEYDEATVKGRSLAFASTNGSLAMLAARRAGRRVLAAFVNLHAVLDRVRDETDIAIICAGKLGGFSLEDVACAGMLLARLEPHGAVAEGGPARMARALAPSDAREVRSLVESAAHARDLRALGALYARDLEICASLDVMDHVCELSPARG